MPSFDGGIILDSTGLVVDGNVASAAADSGNPIKVGGVYYSAKPTYTNAQRVEQGFGTRGSAMVQIHGADLAAGADVRASADGVSSALNVLGVNSVGLLYNGTNAFDRQRGNIDTTTGDTGSKTTGTFNGATQTNYNARGAIVTMLVGTVTGAITTFQTGLQTSYDGGTTWVGLTPLGANDTTAASGKTYAWYVYPTNWSQTAGTTPATLVPASGPSQANYINAVLPRTWRLTMSLTVATSFVITAVYVEYVL